MRDLHVRGDRVGFDEGLQTLARRPAVDISRRPACLVGVALFAGSLLGCGGPPPPVSDEDRLAQLEMRITDRPDDGAALLERGRLRAKMAQTGEAEDPARAFRGAWDDFRTAFESSGGAWDFGVDPFQKPSASARRAADPKSVSVGGDAVALLEAARLALRLFRPDVAIVLLARAKQLAPDSAEVELEGVFAAAIQSGDLPAATPLARRAAEAAATSKSARTWEILGYLLMHTDDLAGAEKAYRRALELNRASPAARVNLVAVLTGLGKTAEAEQARANLPRSSQMAVLSDNNFATQKMRPGHHHEAIPILESVVTRAPGFPAGWINLGTCYEEVGRYDDAIRAYEHLEQLMPQNPEGKGYLADVYNKKRDYQKALALLEQAAKLPGARINIPLTTVDSLVGLGRFAESEKLLDDLRSHAPDVWQVWNKYAIFLQDRQRFPELLALVDQALMRFKDEPLFLRYRVTALLGVQRDDDAQSAADVLIARGPNAMDYVVRALIRRCAGAPDVAQRPDLEEALRRDPGHAYASLLLWIIDAEASDRKRGDERLREAIRLAEPGNWYGKLCEFVVGDLPGDDLLKQASDDGQRCEAFYFIGERTRAVGPRDAAAEWFEKCLKADKPDFWETRLARARLGR